MPPIPVKSAEDPSTSSSSPHALGSAPDGGDGGAGGEPRSIEDPARELQRELEEERRARQHAEAVAEDERRLAKALAQLATAMATSDGLEAFLPKLLELVVDVARPHVAVLRLREGDRLRSRAAFESQERPPERPRELDEEVTSGFSRPSSDENAAGSALVLLPPAEEGARGWSEAIRKNGVQTLYSLPLVDGSTLVGAVYLGELEMREFSDADKRILAALAPLAAAAIARQSQAASHPRDDVLSIVAHDLQNPITVISIAANTLLQRLSESSVRRPIERIIRSAQRAARLIQDLLEIDAVETGRFSIETSAVEPADVILLAVESQQNLAADASVIIGADLSPDLSAFEADAERLLEVLENLVGNAVKFTNPGGSITVGAARQKDEILLWVKDSGTGISPDQMPHIFDRFWQAKKAERRGTGLGLTICKAIVEAHGGRIWAESILGVGTTVYFTIPAPAARSGEIDAADIANILLVDDRPENLMALEAILEQPGYRLVTATSGEDALRLALRESFSVALVDIAMPGMNGLEVAVHLKALERSRDIPIIFVTAFGDDPQEIHRAYSAGGADYLVKPLDAEIVRKKVAVFVDLSRRRRGKPAAKAIATTTS